MSKSSTWQVTSRSRRKDLRAFRTSTSRTQPLTWAVIDDYDLGAFFERLEPEYRYGSRGDHYLMRPRGYDWKAGWEEIPAELAKWRSDYKKLPAVKQLMVAAIVRLYNSQETYWLVRVPKKWHAAEGIEILRNQGALADWAKLYALYPGW